MVLAENPLFVFVSGSFSIAKRYTSTAGESSILIQLAVWCVSLLRSQEEEQSNH